MLIIPSEARNELWFVLELAKTLVTSNEFKINPPDSAPTTTKNQNANPATKPNPNLISSLQQINAEPPILPPGTFTSTPSQSISLTTHAQALTLELALKAKQKAIEECSDMIDAAVQELQSMAKAGERFWTDVKELKDGVGGKGRWAVVGRPDFGRSMAEGEAVRDVVVPYAIDEGEYCQANIVRRLIVIQLLLG
jgi:hypothetical protein